jgi:hypothetical protein
MGPATARRLPRSHSSFLAVACLALVFAVMTGCGPTDPLQLNTIQVGRSLNPDSSIAEHTTSFRKNDTVYVAVLTNAPGRGTIRVRWTYGGQLIDEPQREVVYREAAATSFHLVNSGGFPPGNYSVEAFIDGQSVGTRNFRVE